MLDIAYIDTPFGQFELKGSSLGLQSAKKVDKSRPASKEIPPSLQAAAQQLQEYFKGERQSFDLDLDWDSEGTNSQVSFKWVSLLWSGTK